MIGGGSGVLGRRRPPGPEGGAACSGGSASGSLLETHRIEGVATVFLPLAGLLLGVLAGLLLNVTVGFELSRYSAVAILARKPWTRCRRRFLG